MKIKKIEESIFNLDEEKKITDLISNYSNLNDNQINELSTYIIMYSLHSLLSDDILNHLRIISNDKPLTREGSNCPLIGQCGIYKDRYYVFFGKESKNRFKKGTKSMFYSALVTFGHEFQHVLRKYQLKNGIVDVQLLIIALEELNIELDKSFYIDNYRKLFSEIDAEKAGIKVTYNFLKKYNISLLNGNYKEFYKYMLEKSKFDISLFFTNDEILNYVYFLITNVKDLLPSSLDLLDEIPILKCIFHNDGSIVKIEELKERLISSKLNITSKDDVELFYAVLYKSLERLYSSDKKI